MVLDFVLLLNLCSKEHNDVNKANNELKPPQKSGKIDIPFPLSFTHSWILTLSFVTYLSVELVSDEYGQRQNKPRRQVGLQNPHLIVQLLFCLCIYCTASADLLLLMFYFGVFERLVGKLMQILVIIGQIVY